MLVAVSDCVCAIRGYCADVRGDPLACPVCLELGDDDECPAAPLATPDAWLWLGHDGDVLARGRRELVERERGAYERSCHELGIVPAVTSVQRAPAAAPRR